MDLSVREAAARLNVSERRVQALIEAQRIPARRVGRAWLIDSSGLARARYRSRPLSPRMAHALLSRLSGDDDEVALAASERSRLGARLQDLLDDGDPADRLHSWLAAAAHVRRYGIASPDLRDLAADQRVVPSGVSDERSGLAVVDEFEGWIAREDLDAVRREYLLSERGNPNVVLHLAQGQVPRPVPLGLLLADLAGHAGPREAAAVRRLLQENARPLIQRQDQEQDRRVAQRANGSRKSPGRGQVAEIATAARAAKRAVKAEAEACRAVERARKARAAAKRAEKAAAKAASGRS